MGFVMKLILASASPRRRELLSMAGFDFEVVPADVDEEADPALSPDQLVAFLSEKKALHIFNSFVGQDAIIVGADTVVAIDGLILGKPSNSAAAFDMLSRLQGRQHKVFTGVSLISCKERTAKGTAKTKTFVESTKVFMRSLSSNEIQDYIATGEPLDKAGSYGIQERGALLIERLEGDYFTVVGLPLCRFNLALQEFL